MKMTPHPQGRRFSFHCYEIEILKKHIYIYIDRERDINKKLIFPGDLTKVVPLCLPGRCGFLTCFDRITYSLQANGREREGGPLLVWDSPVAIIIILQPPAKTLLLFPQSHTFSFSMPCPALPRRVVCVMCIVCERQTERKRKRKKKKKSKRERERERDLSNLSYCRKEKKRKENADKPKRMYLIGVH